MNFKTAFVFSVCCSKHGKLQKIESRENDVSNFGVYHAQQSNTNYCFLAKRCMNFNNCHVKFSLILIAKIRG